MIKLDDNLLVEIGLGNLPKPEKTEFLKHMYETLEMRVGTRLAERMSEQQMSEFERFISTNDEQGAFQWLESNFPNYKDVVAEEFDKLKSEIRPLAPQIVATSQTQAAGALPGQAPAVPPMAAMPPATTQSAQPVDVQPQPVQPQPLPAQSAELEHFQPPADNPLPAYQQSTPQPSGPSGLSTLEVPEEDADLPESGMPPQPQPPVQPQYPQQGSAFSAYGQPQPAVQPQYGGYQPAMPPGYPQQSNVGQPPMPQQQQPVYQPPMPQAPPAGGQFGQPPSFGQSMQPQPQPPVFGQPGVPPQQPPYGQPGPGPNPQAPGAGPYYGQPPQYPRQPQR